MLNYQRVPFKHVDFPQEVTFFRTRKIHWIDCPSSIFAKDPLWFCSSIVMSRRTSTVSPGSTCPSFRRIRSPAAFSKRAAAFWEFFAENPWWNPWGKSWDSHGKWYFYTLWPHMWRMFCGTPLELMSTVWSIYIYIYMDQTWGPNGPKIRGINFSSWFVWLSFTHSL